jgi:hypothetical protein
MVEKAGSKGEHIAVGFESGELRVLHMSTLENVSALLRDY